MKLYRHGDVLIRQVAKIPKAAKATKKGKDLTIALGEATGHHHTLYGRLPMSMLEFDSRRYLDITEEVALKHQEHNCLSIPPGKYEIIIEQEHDYFINEARKVVD